MKKIFYSMLTMIVLVKQEASGQDLQLSQFYQTPLYRNPALSGIMFGDLRMQAVMRSQWNSLANAYKTGSFNIEYKTKPGNGDDYITWGLQSYYDRAGTADLTTTIIMPALNYHRSLGQDKNKYLSIGFMGGYVQRRFDRSKITTNTGYDTGQDGENMVNPSISYWDGSVGLSYNSSIDVEEKSNLVLGLAYHHFNKPSNSFYDEPAVKLDPKIVVSADLKLDINDYSNATIYTDYLKQGSYSQFIGGLLYGLKIGSIPDQPDYLLQAGIFFRYQDAIIPTLKLDYGKMSAGFSYDVNISKLSEKSTGRGGFELSITYVGFLDKYNSSLDAIRCPKF